MKKIYYRYELWEDHKNGMYQDGDVKNEEIISKAESLLKNNKKFLEVGLKVIDNWIYATETNLTNKNRNRQAWIGQASCSYMYNVPENLTKMAWHKLTLDEKNAANSVADKVINYFEYRKKNKCRNKNLELMF